MRKLSLQWRITLMTSLLIAAACISMNLLLYSSGSFYIDALGGLVLDYQIDTFKDPEQLYISIPEGQMDEFFGAFSDQVDDTKTSFSINGWLITALVTLLSGVIAYFVSGRSLKPLREFSNQVERIQMENLTESAVNENEIPEFRMLSQSFNQMLGRISTAFEAQRQFTGNAAHELRTPLALMQAQMDLYTKEQGKMTDMTEIITTLQEQTERLSLMVTTLLDMSELETVRRTDRIELVPMIEEILADLSPVAEKQNITLEQAGEEVELTGSDILIYRVIFNLVENAIKYNRPGGRVTVSTGRSGSKVLIRVADTGGGIPPEYQKSIFQPFFRVDKSVSRALGGVGLGLALVWETVKLHGGRVWIEKSTPAGTVFTVELPAARDLKQVSKIVS
ncbi:two-component sensor histidine kinase [Lachnospiraceae bacterium oral taxon 500]|nr:two-component sensor histidine kinase [Lachnospiraceae bacterium oral taxon 500]